MPGSKFAVVTAAFALGGAFSGCWGTFRDTPPAPTTRRQVEVDAEHATRARRRPAPDAGGTAEVDAGADASLADAGRVETGVVDDEVRGSLAPAPRVILSGAVTNARDLGGTPLARGASVAYGKLYRGPPLAKLSAADCEEFERLGIRTVIDLRISAERDGTPEAACVSQKAKLVFAPLPVPYNVSPSDYIADLNATESILEAFRFLGDSNAYPIYFHCTWGRDRTGVLAAVILRALGSGRAEIQREYSISAETVGAYPASLDAVLAEIERRGGIDAYLEAAGVRDAQVETLRHSAVQPARP